MNAVLAQIPLQGGGELFVANQGENQGVIGKVKYRFIEGRFPKGKVELRWTNRDGSQSKRRFNVTGEKELKNLCWDFTDEARGKGSVKLPTVKEAVADAIRASLQNPESRDNSGMFASQFFNQVRKVYSQFDPEATTIDELDSSMIEETVANMHRNGLARDTIRQYLQPVKQGINHAARKYRGHVDPCFPIRLPEAAPREIECLDSVKELDFFLSWLRKHRKGYYPIACLQALAGLRVREAINLRAQDIDLEAGTIRIDETPRHRPKNANSYRTIPVCGELLQVLEGVATAEVVSIDGYLFLTRDRRPYVERNIVDMWKRMRSGEKGIVEAEGFEVAKRLKPRSLRKTFATFADRLGVPDRLLKRYLGQSSNDVLGRHYRRIGVEDLRVVSEAMSSWRDLPALEASLSKSVKKQIAAGGNVHKLRENDAF